MIAKAIHEASPRRNYRFVALNCAAIPSALLESELFGHEKGAFTGAWALSKGRFQTADGGTLFLDEIGDMPLELQPKLLRVLQEQEFERLGGAQTVRVNVRVVAATNQDVGQLVSISSFGRICSTGSTSFHSFCLPRERIQDIRPIVEFFVAKLSARLNRTIDSIPEEVMEVLKAHDWPGNIRELQNSIERAVVLSSGPVLRPTMTDLQSMTKPSNVFSARTLAEASREHILDVLKQTRGMIGGRDGAAERLGMPRTTLIYKMRKLGIETLRSSVAQAQAW